MFDMLPKAIIVFCLCLPTILTFYMCALYLPKRSLSITTTKSSSEKNGKTPMQQRLRNGIYLTNKEKNQTVYSFQNVCIEDVRKQIRGRVSKVRTVVVYDDYTQPGNRRLSVAGSVMTLWNHWDILFKSESELPKNITYRAKTAFFISPTIATNVFHFLNDEYIPLFSIMKISKNLNVGSKVQLVYRALAPKGYDQSQSRFESMLFSLNVDRFHARFSKYPENTCFRTGFFGLMTILERKRDVVDYTLSRFNISARDVLDRNNSVTITYRRKRQILNIIDLKTWAHLAGFKNVRIVDFEQFSVRDQLKIAATSSVLIGVQGAALQWSMFMPAGSHLIEIAWPQKGWIFYYGHIPEFAINYHQVIVTNITEPHKKGAKIPHKFSDVIVKREEIFGTLQVVYHSLFENEKI